MDLGLHPETKAGGPLLELRPSLAFGHTLSASFGGGPGPAGEGKNTVVGPGGGWCGGGGGMAFLLQAVRLPDQPWSLPSQDFMAVGAAREVCLLLVYIDLSDLGAGLVVFVFF